MNTYIEAAEQLGGKASRKLENNTYLHRIDEHTIAVKLHDTDVVTYYDDGRIVLNSGGWRTVTTKDRMEKYSPVWLRSFDGDWHIARHGEAGYRKTGDIFNDGVTLEVSSDGELKITGAGQSTVKLRKQAWLYVKRFVESIIRGDVGVRPSNGDCWYCVMKDKDGKTLGDLSGDSGHIKDHIKADYFVPSLLYNAIKETPVSPFAEGALATLENGGTLTEWQAEIMARQVTHSLKRYLGRRLGFAVR